MSTYTDSSKSSLIINKLTQAQYEASSKSDAELWILTDVIDYQVDLTLPVNAPSAKYVGQITQHIGATSGSYVNGYFYKCVALGTDPETYRWSPISPSNVGEGILTIQLNGVQVGTFNANSSENKTINIVNRYVHEQVTSATEWTITHNLGCCPSVTVVDTANNVLITDVQYIDLNTLKVISSENISGKAYLN